MEILDIWVRIISTRYILQSHKKFRCHYKPFYSNWSSQHQIPINMKLLIFIQVIFLLGFFFIGLKPVEAGLTSYLPSMSILNPFSWLGYGRKVATSNSTLTLNSTKIDRSDDNLNSSHTLPINTTTLRPQMKDTGINNSIKDKNGTISMAPHYQSTTAPTQTPSPPTNTSPIFATGSVWNMFTTRKPTGTRPSKLKIKKDNKLYDVRINPGYLASMSNKSYLNAFDSSPEDKKINSRSSEDNVELHGKPNQTSFEYDSGNSTNSTTTNNNDNAIVSRWWNWLTVPKIS